MTKTITLTNDGVALLIEALNMRRNYIETGCVTLGAADIVNINEDGKRRLHAEIRALSTDQMRLIIKIDDLCKQLLSSKVDHA